MIKAYGTGTSNQKNIMLQRGPGDEEHVKLIDFGIAKIQPAADKGISSTFVVGSPDYMAPEQYEGKPTAASDIYALGVIAYELVTGRKPFAAGSVSDLLTAQRQGAIPRPSQINPWLPQTAEEAILRSLRYQPDERFQQAREFGHVLGETLERPAGEERRKSNLTAGWQERGEGRKPVWRFLEKLLGGTLIGTALSVVVLMGLFVLEFVTVIAFGPSQSWLDPARDDIGNLLFRGSLVGLFCSLAAGKLNSVKIGLAVGASIGVISSAYCSRLHSGPLQPAC
jgi:hypothetical protein